jgi:phage tail sheath gpL-like
MPIEFQNIPANWKQPLYWVEVDGSMAGFPESHMAALIVGTMTTANTDDQWNGVGTPEVPVLIGRQMDADHLFGQGSELACAMRAYFNNNFANEVWAFPMAETLNASPATGTLTIATPATEAGTISLYIAGHHIPINVFTTMTVNEIATVIADAVNAMPDLPVTAVAGATGGLVTLTAKWGGVSGNEITMMDSYYGSIGGDVLPVGLTITYSGFTLSGGVGTPDFQTAISALGEYEYEFVSLPYTDSNTLLVWEEEYGFGDNGRWGWMRQHFGHIFSARRGTYSDLVTWGLTRNGKTTSVMGFEVTSLSPNYEWAAAYTAKAARALINDPARPLQTLHLEEIIPARLHERFNLLELNTMSGSGIATQRTLTDNTPMIARETTTYQLNLYGFGDDAFELVTTLATLAKLIRNQRYAITTKYPRHKLADDDTRFGPGQAIVTPKIIKAELVAEYEQDMWNGLVENLTQFKNHLIVERDPNDPNRLNVLYPPDLINQLRIFAVLAQFRLQYDRGVDSAIL